MLMLHPITVEERLKSRTCLHNTYQLLCISSFTIDFLVLPGRAGCRGCRGGCHLHSCPPKSQVRWEEKPCNRSTHGAKGRPVGALGGDPAFTWAAPAWAVKLTSLAMNYQQGTEESLEVAGVWNQICLRKTDQQLCLGQAEGEEKEIKGNKAVRGMLYSKTD